MVNARNKGKGYELKIAEEFRNILGYFDCVTSRSESKRLDDAGVDLCNTGEFNVQCKAWEKAPSYHDVLAGMPQNGKWNVVFHKRNRKGEVVVMSKETFYYIISQMQEMEIILYG